MKILYIYPHPDDESFGPAVAMSYQNRQGHEVFLLTLTRGGATKQRHKYGYSIEKMGEVRYNEMLDVEKTLGLAGMKVLDFPDSGLKEIDPRDLEKAVIEEIHSVKPEVVVTYPVHGISGFHDHLVTHAVVKHAYLEVKEHTDFLKRLAFHTITEEQATQSKLFPLHGSTPQEIDCIYHSDDADVERANNALDCYVTFQETIKNSGIREMLSKEIYFEIFQEDFKPPLNDLFEAFIPYSPNQTEKMLS